MSNLTETFQEERKSRRAALINQMKTAAPKTTLPADIQENDITKKDVVKFILAVAAGSTVIVSVGFTFYMIAYFLLS